MEGVFIRKFLIKSCGKSLTLCQKEVGDVSCVVWDAALVTDHLVHSKPSGFLRYCH